MATKLSQKDKYIIQGMLHDEKSHKEIGIFLKRSAPTIKKYVEGELDNLHSTMVNIELQQAEAEIEEQKKEIEQLKTSDIPSKKPLKAGDMMIKETAKQRGGISVMTSAASEKGDVDKQTHPETISRSCRGNLWNIEKEEYIGGNPTTQNEIDKLKQSALDKLTKDEKAVLNI